MGITATAADCELRDAWGFDQDVNAWSSVAFVVAGVVIATWALRGRLPRAFVVLGGLLVVEGAGSVLSHGAPSTAAQLLHDVPIFAIVGFVAGWHVGQVGGSTSRPWQTAVTGAAAGLAVSLLWPGAQTAAAAGAVLALLVAELLAGQRGLPGVWDAHLGGLAGAAGALWVAGRSGSPLCDPESLVQLHGAWHVAAAVLAVAWAARAATLGSRVSRGVRAGPAGRPGTGARTVERARRARRAPSP